MSYAENSTENLRHELDDMSIHYHNELIDGIISHLGPSIHDADASLVACSDEQERTTIKQNFLIGKLGLEDSPKLDQAIEEVCHAMGHSNTKKHRATFYYLLVAILKQEEKFLAS
jgi:hypothetical protein